MRRLFRIFLDFIEERENATARSVRLLRSNLTPSQQDQYEHHHCFDVIGGESGNRYRIHHGDYLNVYELGPTGARLRRWCFLPVGNLPVGDVLLAQKLALEIFEGEARAIARKQPYHN
jgi:hypothetical protein